MLERSNFGVQNFILENQILKKFYYLLLKSYYYYRIRVIIIMNLYNLKM